MMTLKCGKVAQDDYFVVRLGSLVGLWMQDHNISLCAAVTICATLPARLTSRHTDGTHTDTACHFDQFSLDG